MLLVSNLSIRFQDRRVIENLSFELAPGASLAITGPSGCGKTTLLKAICGFVGEFEDGEISFNNVLWQNSAQTLLNERERPATLLFQDLGVWPHLTVKQQVELVDPKAQKSSSHPRISTEQLIKELGLTERTDVQARFLSGGEKQRVALGRALRTLPQILALDEPFNALDPRNKQEAIELLARLKERFGFSLIMATHQPAEAERFSATFLPLTSRP